MHDGSTDRGQAAGQALRAGAGPARRGLHGSPGPQQIGDLPSGGVVQGLIAQEPYKIGVDAAHTGKATTPKILTDMGAITSGNLAANSKYEYQTTC